MTTVSALVGQALARSVDHVFALMGNGNAHLLDELSRTSMPVTAVRHEAATVSSADAYHRVTRRVAAATTTYGAGFTNALTALAEAAMARTPLVLVVGDAPSGGPRPFDVDQAALTRAVGAHLVMLDTQAPGRDTVAAVEHAIAHRVPVVVAIPYDLPTAEAADATIPQVASSAPLEPDASSVAKAAEELAEAKRPLVLAGRGARDAADILVRLADRVGALTATTAPARGLFLGRGLDVGICGGFATPTSAALIQQADVVLVVGAGLNPFTMAFGQAFGSGARVVQVDLKESPTHASVDVHLRGDARATATQLLSALDELGHAPEGGTPWHGQAEEVRSGSHLDVRDPGEEVAPDGRLDPRAVFTRLEAMLPTQRQVVCDGGHFIGWPGTYLDQREPDGTTMVGTTYQSIGLGLPSAPGAIAARPDVTTVIVVGDGGGLMGLPDLDTVVRMARSALVVVVDDSAYGAEVHQYGSQGLDETLMRFPDVDFAGIARGFGAQAATISTLDDLEAVRQWLDAGAHGTFLADVRVSPDVIAPFMHEMAANAARRG